MGTSRRILKTLRRRAYDGAEQYLSRSWRPSLTYARWQFDREHPQREQKILVHQMGRVGSRSLDRALRSSVEDATVYHLHFLNDRTIATTESQLLRKYEVTGRADIPEQFLAARYLNGELKRNKGRSPDGGKSRWKVVSLVRDPMVRHVSAFFQFFRTTFPEYPADFHHDPANVPALRDLLVDRCREDREYMANWFDEQLNEPLGIDVFSTPFPFGRGYQTYEGPMADLLVLRLEDLKQTAPEALSKFLGLTGLSIARYNAGSRKAHGAAYKAFRTSAEIPDSVLDDVYGSRLARHFYSPEDLAMFRERWRRTSD